MIIDHVFIYFAIIKITLASVLNLYTNICLFTISTQLPTKLQRYHILWIHRVVHYFAFEYSMVQKSFVLEFTLDTGSFTYEILCPLISRNGEMTFSSCLLWTNLSKWNSYISGFISIYLQNETIRVPLIWEKTVCP